MARILLVLFLSLKATIGGAAISTNQLRELAYAGDIVSVEEALREAHRESLTGDISYDDLRNLMIVLLTSHPDMVNFVDVWADQSPNSPYALTARAFQHYYRAFDLRGVERGSQVHPFAHYTFRGSHNAGMVDAEKARDIAPDFVPASDAVFVLQTTTNQLWSWEVDNIISETMAVTPNLGSMRRMASMSRREWGGNGHTFNVNLCDEYSSQLPRAEGVSGPACIVHLMASANQLAENWALVDSVLDKEDSAALEFARVLRAVLQRRVEDAHLIEAYLDKQTFDDPWLSMKIWIAHAYSLQFPIPDKGREELAAYRERMLDGVRAQLVDNPFETSLLKIMTGDYPMIESKSVSYTPEYRMYAARLATIQPFSADAWKRLARATPQGISADKIDLRTVPTVNAIYYSGHDLELVERYMKDQIRTYLRYFDYNMTGYHMHWDFAPEEVFRQDIGCRAARLVRLFDHITANDPEHVQYGQDILSSDVNTFAIAHIQKHSECGNVWTAPIEAIAFTPMPLDPALLYPLPETDG